MVYSADGLNHENPLGLEPFQPSKRQTWLVTSANGSNNLGSANTLRHSPKIKFDHLADLSEDDLRELGVAAMGDRKTLSRAIAALA